MKVFGFTIGKKEKSNQPEVDAIQQSTEYSQMSLHVTSSFANQQLVVNDGMLKNFSHINVYREMAFSAEIDFAVDEIVNSIVAVDSEDDVVSLEISEDSFNKNRIIQKKIAEEWKYIYNVGDFSFNIQDWIRSWYIDGILFLYLVYSEKAKSIIDIVALEPSKLNHVVDSDTGEEYYVYTIENSQSQAIRFGSYNDSIKGYKILPDSIVSIDSGKYKFMDSRKVPVSLLHKAIKPFNQLSLVEDSSVVYRVVRAPEKKAFYIGVGDMNENKAKEYIASIMQSYRKKTVYNPQTGTFNNTADIQTMNEDYFVPRRDDGKNTDIQVLPGGSNVGEVTDLEYFKQKLYRSLNIPFSRFGSDAAGGFFGRSSETSREEIKYDSFINKLRSRINILFINILKAQCILRNICTVEEFEQNKYFLRFAYNKINYFSEIKKMEIWTDRFNLVSTVVGVKQNFIPDEWIYKVIMDLSDEEIAELKEMLVKQSAEQGPTDDFTQDDSSEPMADAPQDASGAGGDFFDTSAFGGEEGPATDSEEHTNNISSLISSLLTINDIPHEDKTNLISHIISGNDKKSKTQIASFINKHADKMTDSDIDTISSLIGGRSSKNVNISDVIQGNKK